MTCEKQAQTRVRSFAGSKCVTNLILTETRGPVQIITINRPEVRNAVNIDTAKALYAAFLDFEDNDDAKVAVFTGSDGAFCGGYDLKMAAKGVDQSWFDEHAIHSAKDMGDRKIGPMGPSRLQLSKPVIAAVEGPAVAGGMELALWADMRVMARTAFFGVYCRRWGVPLIDGGAIRLPRIVGQSRAMDLILTGRKCDPPKRSPPKGSKAPGALVQEKAVAVILTISEGCQVEV